MDEAAKQFPGFKTLYSRLSEYTHPVPAAFPSAWHPSPDEDDGVRWSSTPHFKTVDGPLWAILWLMELTDVHIGTWPQLYAQAARRSHD